MDATLVVEEQNTQSPSVGGLQGQTNVTENRGVHVLLSQKVFQPVWQVTVYLPQTNCGSIWFLVGGDVRPSVTLRHRRMQQ